MKPGLKGKIQKARTELFFQIRSAYKFLCRDKLMQTHLRELTFLLNMIPQSITEYEGLLNSYINEKAEHDRLQEELLAQLGPNSPQKSPTKKKVFFAEYEEEYDLNCTDL